MPYILVDIVLGMLSLVLFVVTSAALLSKYSATHRYLPKRLRSRRPVALIAHAIVLTLAAVAGARLAGIRLFSPYLSDVFFCLGLLNATVLAFQFMDARYFLATPRLQRGLLIGTVSFVVTVVPTIAVIVAVIVLFTIR